MKTPSACRRAGPAARAMLCSLAALPWAALADDPPPTAIGQVEYFFNEDPGPGNGTVLAVTGPTLSFTAAVSGLEPGVHTVYLRTRPTAGEWGPVFPFTVTIEPSSRSASLAAWEYSVDALAPPGGGTALPPPTGGGGSATVQTTLALEDKPGTAMVYLRAKDSDGVWGPAFPFIVAIEGSSSDEVPATLQYSWITEASAPAWQSIALPSGGGATVSHSFQPPLAGMTLGTHMLAVRSLDGTGTPGVPFFMPVALVPDSLTGHTPAATALVAYATNAAGVIAGSEVTIPLGPNPSVHHSLTLPLGAADAGPAEVVAYLTNAENSPAPQAKATFSIVVDGTNGYAAWRDTPGYFTVEERADGAVSGPLADPDSDRFPNQVEFAFGGHPRESSAGLPPVLDSTNGNLILRFRQLQGGSGHRALNYTASGVRYTVQYASSLDGPWQEGGSEVFEVLGVTNNGDGTDTVEVTPTEAVTTGRDKVFMRLKIHLL